MTGLKFVVVLSPILVPRSKALSDVKNISCRLVSLLWVQEAVAPVLYTAYCCSTVTYNKALLSTFLQKTRRKKCLIMIASWSNCSVINSVGRAPDRRVRGHGFKSRPELSGKTMLAVLNTLKGAETESTRTDSAPPPPLPRHRFPYIPVNVWSFTC